MLSWILSSALRLRWMVTVGAALLVVFGWRALADAPLDAFPEFAPPRIEIQTEVPGLSALEVESLVSAPLEAALQGTPWLETVRSKSVLGLSSVVLLLEPGADLMRARQFVQERTDVAAARLPEHAHRPVILPPLSSTSRALEIGLSSAKLSQVELSTLARWTIRPALMGVRGVANVAIWGQRDRELQVLVDPERLRLQGVTLEEVERATRAATSPETGGFLDTPNQRLVVRHATDLARPEDLAAAGLALRGGAVLRIGDVAEVVEGTPPTIGDAVIDGGPGLMLIIEKEPWGNTLDITRGVDAALAALAPGLTDVHVDPTLFRPATFIEMALENLTHALILGCLLVVLTLVVFLRNWRTALISVVAIPLSLLASALALAWAGYTLNTMVLAGLVIALGEVVDDAIIDVENIARRLRLEPESARRPSFTVILAASLEVRSAVVFGSLIVALVLLPVFFMEGLAGAFFRPMALAYVLAILASLAVALTVTPAMALLLLGGGRARVQGESPLTRALGERYARILPWIVARPRATLAGLGLAIGLAAVAVPFLDEEFLPHFHERDFLMHLVEKPGTSLDAMRRITERASRELLAIPGVLNCGAHLGRAEVADEVVGPNFTELWLRVDSEVDYDQTRARIQAVVDGYPGLYRDVLTYLEERVKEVLTGASASIVVRVFGPELETLRERASAVGHALEGLEGVVDLEVEPQVLVPEIEIRLDPERAALLGLGAADVRHALTTLVQGTRVGEVVEDGIVSAVRVQGTPQTRTDVTALGHLLVDAPDGHAVTLAEVARLSMVPTPNEVKRENASRRMDVTCNVRGRDLAAVAHDIEGRLAGLAFPRGYRAEVLGEYAAREAARARILAVVLVSLIGIFLLLQVEFDSARLALLVLLSLPFALIGGVVSALLGGGVLSLGSLIGFITVFGIAARNSIMLVSHFVHLERHEGQPFGRELVLRGARERLAPVLMTALCAGLALVPLVASGLRPGQEIEHPMACVILGGLVTSTLLCLCVLPGLYLRFARPATTVP